MRQPETRSVTSISFTVDGAPVPQGSMRARLSSSGQLYVHDSQAHKLRAWRREIRDAARAHAATPLLQAKVKLRLMFRVPCPRTRPELAGAWCGTKPDTSKLARAVEDALVDAHLIVDDAQVVVLTAGKRYANPPHTFPGVDITVEPI